MTQIKTHVRIKDFKIKKKKNKILEVKPVMSEMQNMQDRISDRLVIAEETISKFEDIKRN